MARWATTMLPITTGKYPTGKKNKDLHNRKTKIQENLGQKKKTKEQPRPNNEEKTRSAPKEARNQLKITRTR